jgi:hypothetical protein
MSSSVSKEAKLAFIIEYINSTSIKAVDILNEDFVDAYIAKFNPKHTPTMWGAWRCKEISRILKFGFDTGMLCRYASSLPEHPQGFPNWIYIYTLTHFGREFHIPKA